MINVNLKQGESHVVAEGLWQWDFGQVLRLQGIVLPAVVEVHFSLTATGTSATPGRASVIRVGVTNGGVTEVSIPDVMLENRGTVVDYTIYAFVYVADEHAGNTLYRIDIPVKVRSKPGVLDVPKEREEDLFRRAVTLVDEAAANAENAANVAMRMASNASLSESFVRHTAAKVGELSAQTEQAAKVAQEAAASADCVTAKVEAVDSGVRVTVTDKNGTTTATVANGKDGAPGEPGYTPVKGVDYFDGADYVLTDADKTEIAGMVDSVPDYIATEAERVAKVVQTTRTAKTFVMICGSDMHLKDGGIAENQPETLASAQCAGMGIHEISKRIGVDCVAMLGDYSFMDAKNYTAEQTVKDITLAKKLLSTSGAKELWSVGNHDWCYGTGVDRMLTEDEVYAHIGANSDGAKPYSDIERGYGYLDFEQYKLRVINLNTCDCKDGKDNGTDYGANSARLEFVSPTQMRWLADEALNFTDKGEGWGVVLVSHHPVDYGNPWFSDLLKMLEAYRAGNSVTLNLYKYHNGTAWVRQEETFNFSAMENRAEIICNIHGHSHNCGSAKVSSSTCTTNATSGVAPWLWRFCIPNMCVGRENEKWDTIHGEVDAGGNAVYHRKEAGTAKATAFNVVSIDRKNKKMYAHIFGAGKDRVMSYAEEDVTPTNLLDMSVRTLDNSYTDNYIESTAAHTMDYTKAYAVASDNRRGAYATAKFSAFTVTDNGFSANCSSASGYRLEFPVDVEGGKTYTLSVDSDAAKYTITLLKYNADTSLNGASALLENAVGAQTVTFTPESGYLYSIVFPFGSGVRNYTDLSLV